MLNSHFNYLHSFLDSHNIIFYAATVFRGLYQGVWGNSRETPSFGGVSALNKLCYDVADKSVMQTLHKNENLD